MGKTEAVTDVLMVTGVVAGGVGRHVQQLTQGLVARGHPVTVACPTVVASRFDLAEAGAQVCRVEIGSHPAPLRHRRVAAQLRRAMSGVDVVHAHGLRAGALAAMARDDHGPPLVVTSHNAAPQGRLAAVAYRGLERVVCRSADLVLGVSDDLVARARARRARDVDRAVVPALRARPEKSREHVRAALGLAPGQRLVVAVGRLSPQKGFDRLLEPAVTQALVGRDAVLVIAGEGPQAEALQRRVERTGAPVRLLGHRDDVHDLLAAADLAVSAARWEGQPVWLQEALSAGVAIVATDAGGTAEVLGDGGLLVPADDTPALAAALGDVLADPAQHADLRRRARQRAERLPTADDAVQSALTSYGRAARNRRTTDVD